MVYTNEKKKYLNIVVIIKYIYYIYIFSAEYKYVMFLNNKTNKIHCSLYFSLLFFFRTTN
jgi:hypothetical protein